MSKKKLMIAGGGSLAALLGFGFIFAYIVGGSLDTDSKLRFAMKLLDDGRWDLAGRLANELSDSGEVVPEENAAWHYVTGVSKLKAVNEKLDTPANRRKLKEAVSNLEKASELGFPIGYEGKGRYYLGFACFHTYQWKKVAENLKNINRLLPEKRSQGFHMLVESHLRMTPKDIGKAKSTLEKWRELPGQSASEKAMLKLAESDVALVEKDYDACEELLAEIPDYLPEFPQATVWRGRWRVRAAEDLDDSVPLRLELLETAKNLFAQAILSADTPEEMRRRATYLKGRALRLLGSDEALGTFSKVRQRAPQSAEAIAAGLEEAELMLESREPEKLPDVVRTAQHILRNIEDLSLCNELWLPVEELRTRLFDIGRELKEAKKHGMALDLATYTASAFPLPFSVRLQAETLEDWGDSLSLETPGNTAEERERHRELTNLRYIQAGRKYEELAELEMRSKGFAEIVWHSAICFQKGNALNRANEQLQEYIKYEERTKLPRGFVALARNLMNAGEWAAALEPLSRCLREFPDSPVSYEARLLAAHVNNELGQLDEAIELLDSNMRDFQLTPRSKIYQDCLFTLGQTTYNKAEGILLTTKMQEDLSLLEKEKEMEKSAALFDQAIAQLSEAKSRYEDDPRYLHAMYLIAKSYCLAAETPKFQAESNPNVIETARRQLLQERRLLLENALVIYQEMRGELDKRFDNTVGDSNHQTHIRNSFFGEADTLYELKRYDEAIAAYRAAASRFSNKPEALEALVQQADCHRKLGRDADANHVLNQAVQTLRRIPADNEADFVNHTRGSRAEWESLLTWLKS